MTHLLAAGSPVPVVAKRAGHAGAKMALDVYGQVLSGQDGRCGGAGSLLRGRYRLTWGQVFVAMGLSTALACAPDESRRTAL